MVVINIKAVKTTTINNNNIKTKIITIDAMIVIKERIIVVTETIILIKMVVMIIMTPIIIYARSVNKK